MIVNLQPDRTIEQVFDSVFYPSLGIKRVDVQATLDAFYADDFPNLRSLTEFRPQAVELVEGALAHGYKVAIATNPLFPRTAILQRLAWAGLSLEKYPIALVPDFESFHFAKPNPHYYAEFLARLGWPEEPVVIVGDDLENDILPARQLGLPVYWVPNQPTEWNGPGEPPIQGRLADILPWLDLTPMEQLTPDYTSPASMLVILRTTPAVLQYFCQGKHAAELSVRPAEGEWSPGEVLCHLRDVEQEVFLPRLHKVTQEDNPFLSGRDTDRWAEERRYIEQDGLQALRDFTQTRMEQLVLLEGLKAEEWSLSARHAIFGPTQLHELVNITAGHDRLHIRQVYRAM
jgi:HAD superfamily hydrolase (TIGR01549 family)